MPRFKNKSKSPKQGKVINKNFINGQPSGTTLNVTAATTVTFTNGVMRVAGGSGSVINYSENLTINQFYASDEFEHFCVFKPIIPGLGFILRRQELGTGASNWLRVELTNDARKGKVTWGYGITPSTSTDIQMSTFSYDSTDLLFVRETFNKNVGGHYLEFGYYREKGNTVINLRTPVDRHKQWQSQLCFIGGTVDFYELSVNSRIARGADIIAIGDSNMFCYDASGIAGAEVQYGYMYNLQRMTNKVIDVVAFSQATIDDHQSYIDIIIDANPEYVLINDGTNSMLNGETLAAYMVKYLAYCAQLLNAGIKIIHFGSFPGNPPLVLSQYISWNAQKALLANGTTQFYVDLYTQLKAPGNDNLNPAYWGGLGFDGTHLAFDKQQFASNGLFQQLKPFINI